MRYPNLRYGNPVEMQYYAQGIPLQALAKRLRKDTHTVQNWLDGKQRVPFWVPELLRLQHMESNDRLRRMGFTKLPTLLRIVPDNTSQTGAQQSNATLLLRAVKWKLLFNVFLPKKAQSLLPFSRHQIARFNINFVVRPFQNAAPCRNSDGNHFHRHRLRPRPQLPIFGGPF